MVLEYTDTDLWFWPELRHSIGAEVSAARSSGARRTNARGDFTGEALATKPLFPLRWLTYVRTVAEVSRLGSQAGQRNSCFGLPVTSLLDRTQCPWCPLER